MNAEKLNDKLLLKYGFDSNIFEEIQMNPWGAIIAALIAGFIAFIGMVITKENKVSEFRQEWIKELRGHISKLFYLYGFLKSDSKVEEKERKEIQNQVNEVIANIRLHLNHGNKSNDEEQLLDLVGVINKEVDQGTIYLTPLYDELIDKSHLVLKSEWERVKFGEKSYIFVKNTLFALSVFVVSLGVISLTIYAMVECGILSQNLIN